MVMDASKGSSRTFQIFVKMDDSKTVTMDVEPIDKIGDIVRRSVGGGTQDVYATCEGTVLRKDDELYSCGSRDGSTVQTVSMLRGGGKHKDKKNQSEKKQAKSPKRLEPLKRQQEEKREEEPSDEGPGIPEDVVIQKQLKEIEGHLMMIECVLEGNEGEVEKKIKNYMNGFQKLPGVEREQLENIEVAVRRSVEASGKRRGTEREQTTEMEQCMKVRFAEEEPKRTVRGETQAQSTDKQGVMSGLEEVRTDRGSAGLVRVR